MIKHCENCGKELILKTARDKIRKRFCSVPCCSKWNVENNVFSFKGRTMSELSRKKISDTRFKNKKPDTDWYIINNGCWEYTGNLDKYGYGTHCIRGTYMRAHRYFYEKYKGKIPYMVPLDHLCRNPRCVNPDHLEIVTPAINTQRGKLAKLTISDVDEIRKLYKSGIDRKSIIKQFKISGTHYHRIINYQRWK